MNEVHGWLLAMASRQAGHQPAARAICTTFANGVDRQTHAQRLDVTQCSVCVMHMLFGGCSEGATNSKRVRHALSSAN